MTEDRLHERWRQAPRILEARDDAAHVDGVTGFLRHLWNVSLPPEDIERLRTGYLCLRCLEPQETPFPEKCGAWWCTYRIKHCQSDDFALLYEGKRRIGPSTDISEELDRLDDTHERRIHVPGLQILIPRNLQIEGKKVKATGRLHKSGGS